MNNPNLILTAARQAQRDLQQIDRQTIKEKKKHGGDSFVKQQRLYVLQLTKMSAIRTARKAKKDLELLHRIIGCEIERLEKTLGEIQ